jgi:hypothetical protein
MRFAEFSESGIRLDFPPFKVIHIALDCIVVKVAQLQRYLTEYAWVALFLMLEHVSHLLLVHRTYFYQKVANSIRHLEDLIISLDLFAIFSRRKKMDIMTTEFSNWRFRALV